MMYCIAVGTLPGTETLQHREFADSAVTLLANLNKPSD